MSAAARIDPSSVVPIAVVIATRDRPAGAVRAARSVMASGYPAIELCVVDQSESELARELRDLIDESGAQLVQAPPDGLGAARNIGVRLTRAPIVAFTDDDCHVEQGWLQAIAAAFAADPRVGVVFGSVRAPQYDRSSGFIPAYEVKDAHTVRGLARQASVCGIGASLAIRRSTFEKLHGFDEQLGAGTALAAGEDTDMAIRALISGDAVHETPAAVVTHHGFRPWNEGHVVIQGYMRGLGAVHVKMLRLGRARAARPLLALAWRWLARGPVVDLNHRPPRLSRLRAYLAGSWHARGLPVDRATGWYVPVQPSFSRLALNDDRRSRVSIVRAADARGN